MIDDDFDPIEWSAPVFYDAGYALPELGRVALLVLGAAVVAAALGLAVIKRLSK